MPDDCDGDTSALCAAGGIDVQGTGMLRLSKRDGSLRLVGAGAKLPRGMGAELYDTGERRPDYVARIVGNGHQVWKRPLAAMFGADVSSDTGWDWRTLSGITVGSMGLRRARDSKTYDLARWVQAGLDTATGRTLWRVPGRQLQCGGTGEDVLVDGDELSYRCAYIGSVKLLPVRGVDSSKVSAVVEGFDPRTGRTTWRVDVGMAPALAFGDPGPVGLGGSVVAIPRPGRPPLQLDLRTGAHQELTRERPGWCAVQNPYPLSTSAAADAARQGETLQVPCLSDGSPVAVPAHESTGFGIRAGGALIWAGRDGLHAVHV